MAIVFNCPCGKRLQVADNLRGKKVKCPGCRNITVVKAGPAPTLPAHKPPPHAQPATRSRAGKMPPPRSAPKQSPAAADVRADYDTHVCFTPDGQLIAGLDAGNDTVELWEVRTGKHQRTFSPARDFAITPDGKNLLALNRDGLMKVWNVATGAEERSFGTKADLFIPRMEISPDGKLVAAGDQKSLLLYQFENGKLLHTITGGKGTIEAFAFSPDSKNLAVSTRDPINLDLYDLASGKVAQSVKLKTGSGGDQWVTRLVFSPTGRTLAAGCDNGSGIRLLDGHTLKELLKIGGVSMTVQGLAYAPDGKVLAAVDNFEPKVYSWNIRAGK